MKKEDKKQKKAKKEKPPQYVKTLMNTEIVNYQVYYLSLAETVLYFLLAFAVGGIVGYVFFGNLALDEEGAATVMTWVLNVLVICSAGGAAGWFFLPMRAGQLKEKRRKQLLMDFGRRSGIRDIVDFAATFETCYRKGSNIKIVMMKTFDLISNKMQMEEEIKTKISASTNEQYIMLVMPVVITAVVKMMSSEMAANYASPSGIIVTVISIAIFVGAYMVGVRISNIEV